MTLPYNAESPISFCSYFPCVCVVFILIKLKSYSSLFKARLGYWLGHDDALDIWSEGHSEEPLSGAGAGKERN